MTQAVVALDGGGSTTPAVLLDLDGRELRRAEAASASPRRWGRRGTASAAAGADRVGPPRVCAARRADARDRAAGLGRHRARARARAAGAPLVS
ncbi:hypothetical protein [Orlajensenia flava]|uniref:hypothetical protein n=1 Tax=Orlajensenia flava TaxID=2565934 RepID=UPI0010A2D91A|nr:hypothetical protein [Glaciibacter flavus]